MAIDQLTASALKRLEGLPPLQQQKARAHLKTAAASAGSSSGSTSSHGASLPALAVRADPQLPAAICTTTTVPATTSKPKKTKKCRVIVDISACRYAVIRKCLRQRDFRLIKDHAQVTKWDLWWSDRGDFLKELHRLNAFQKINHFPSMEEICRKDFLANNLNAMAKVLPNEYDFFPRTFLLPAESVELQKSMETGPKHATYIVKPRTQCQGKGIFLVQAFSKVPSKEPCVVQRYIANPLLVDGFKFDLRVYVLVYSVDPLEIHIFHNGLARFCTTEFKKPSKSNLDHMRMHLTNYAINKRSKNFQRTNDETKGSKRSICAVMQILESQGFDASEIWARIGDIVIKTLMAIEGKLQASYRSFFGQDIATKREFGPACFEILGFDIMLDAHGTPWLFEVNHAPSFAGDSPLDREIKSALISSALDLVNITNARKKQFLTKSREEWKKRLWSVQPATSRSKKADDKKAPSKMDVHRLVLLENQQDQDKKEDPQPKIDDEPLKSDDDDEEEDDKQHDDLDEEDDEDDVDVDKKAVHHEYPKVMMESTATVSVHDQPAEEDSETTCSDRPVSSGSMGQQAPPAPSKPRFAKFFSYSKPKSSRVYPDLDADHNQEQPSRSTTTSAAFGNFYTCILPLTCTTGVGGAGSPGEYYGNIHRVALEVNRSKLWG